MSALEELFPDEEGVSISDYLSTSDLSHYEKAKSLWAEIPVEERHSFFQNQLKSLRSKQDFSGIMDIHPAWLLRPLEKESPRVIGLILRHLPSKHVRYLLEHLPKRVTMRLPKLVESFYVPSEILALVWRRFERHFHPMPLARSFAQYDFDHIHYLKSEEIDHLLRDLGMSELALSLVGTTKKIAHVLLNRFSIKDAKTLVSRIKEYQNQDRTFCRESRYTVLELDGEEHGVEAFLKELGAAAFSKAFQTEQMNLFRAVSQKMSPSESYLLKRYIDSHLPAALGAFVERRQSWVMDHIIRLSEEGSLDPQWAELRARDAA